MRRREAMKQGQASKMAQTCTRLTKSRPRSASTKYAAPAANSGDAMLHASERKPMTASVKRAQRRPRKQPHSDHMREAVQSRDHRARKGSREGGSHASEAALRKNRVGSEPSWIHQPNELRTCASARAACPRPCCRAAACPRRDRGSPLRKGEHRRSRSQQRERETHGERSEAKEVKEKRIVAAARSPASSSKPRGFARRRRKAAQTEHTDSERKHSQQNEQSSETAWKTDLNDVPRG